MLTIGQGTEYYILVIVWILKATLIIQRSKVGPGHSKSLHFDGCFMIRAPWPLIIKQFNMLRNLIILLPIYTEM